MDFPTTASVIIVTYRRPEALAATLAVLVAQAGPPHQVIVVDSSPGDDTERVVSEWPTVELVRADGGHGDLPAVRNLGLLRARGEVIVFLDDDAVPHPGWLDNLLSTYREPDVGGVGGRALNRVRDEETIGVDRIGQVAPDGSIEGHFAADPGRVLEVQHLIGCNMSFRRQVLAELGGFRSGMGVLRDDTDVCLRVRALGYRLLFNPEVVVDHFPAPRHHGRRFGARYEYHSNRNHIMLLMANYGARDGMVRTYLKGAAARATRDTVRRVGSGVVRFGGFLVGTPVGIIQGARIARQFGGDPRRRDEKGRAIREWLSRSAD